MTFKKVLKYFALILIVGTIVMIPLANRDLTKIYGGLTKRADASQFNPLSGPVVINNVNVLSPDGESFIPEQTVVIEDGLIASIGSAPTSSDQYHSIDGNGKYLIPGLVDTHVHLFKSANDLLLYVANGVTQIRELIGEEDHLDWRRQIQNGRIGPDMFITSPRIGSFSSLEGFFMAWSQGYINLQTPDDAERAVRLMHEQGYDAVKIYSQISRDVYEAVTDTARSLEMKVVGHVPWSLELKDVYANQDSIAHLEEIMNALNREFGDFKAAPGQRWTGEGFGSQTTEEFLAFVESRIDEVADELLKNNVAVSTTLWLVESFVRQKTELNKALTEVALVYVNPGISEWSKTTPRGLGWLPDVNRYKFPDDFTEERKKNSIKYWETYANACQVILKRLNQKGVTIMTGTDANLPITVPGFSLHDEFVSLNQAGMTPDQILRSATAIPSQWLGSNAGHVSVGHEADLILLDRNPLQDISNTKSINSVILKGRVFDRALLDKMLVAVKEANDSSRKVEIREKYGDSDEWHLLKLLRMPVNTNVVRRHLSWHR